MCQTSPGVDMIMVPNAVQTLGYQSYLTRDTRGYPGDLTSAATQMSTLGTSLLQPQQTHPRRTQVKGDIKKLMIF